MGRAYGCTGLQECIIGKGHYWTDDFSIINQGFAGEVDIMGVLGVLLRASIAEVHGWLAGEKEWLW